MSVVAIVPCRDEALSIETVVSDLLGIGVDRVIVCLDPLSKDGTAELAETAGATVILAATSGYDGPVLAGVTHLQRVGYQGNVLFLDGGNKYEVDSLRNFLVHADPKSALVFGIRDHHLFWHQKLGNVGFSTILFLRYRRWVKDVSSVRLMSMDSIARLKYEDRQFSLPFQTVVHALHARMTISYVPIRCKKRVGLSKVSGSKRNSARAAMQMGLSLLRKPSGLR